MKAILPGSFPENLRWKGQADFSASFVHAPGIRLLDSKKTIVMLGVLDVALFAMVDSVLFPWKAKCLTKCQTRYFIAVFSMIFFFVAK